MSAFGYPEWERSGGDGAGSWSLRDAGEEIPENYDDHLETEEEAERVWGVEFVSPPGPARQEQGSIPGDRTKRKTIDGGNAGDRDRIDGVAGRQQEPVWRGHGVQK